MLSYSLKEDPRQTSTVDMQRKRKKIAFVPSKTECITLLPLAHASHVVAAFLCVVTGIEKNHMADIQRDGSQSYSSNSFLAFLYLLFCV